MRNSSFDEGGTEQQSAGGRERRHVEADGEAPLESLMRLALRLTGRVDEAQALVERTLAEACRSGPWIAGAPPVAALRRLCARLSTTLPGAASPLRARNLPGPRFDADGALVPTAAWPDSDELPPEARLSIRNAIAALPREHRAVFVLRDLEGLSCDEVAGVLERPAAAVRRLAHESRLAVMAAVDAAVARAS